MKLIPTQFKNPWFKRQILRVCMLSFCMLLPGCSPPPPVCILVNKSRVEVEVKINFKTAAALEKFAAEVSQMPSSADHSCFDQWAAACVRLVSYADYSADRFSFFRSKHQDPIDRGKTPKTGVEGRAFYLIIPAEQVLYLTHQIFLKYRYNSSQTSLADVSEVMISSPNANTTIEADKVPALFNETSGRVFEFVIER